MITKTETVSRRDSASHAATIRRGAALGPLLFCGLLSLGCGGTPHDHGGSCAQETRAEVYMAGLEKTGKQGALVFRLLDSQPGPPQKGDNTFTLAIKNSAGVPQSAATIAVTPFMPDHGHGSPIKAEVSELASPAGSGQYRASPVNLFMPGLWQITVSAQASGGVSDSAVFAFCIEG